MSSIVASALEENPLFLDELAALTRLSRGTFAVASTEHGKEGWQVATPDHERDAIFLFERGVVMPDAVPDWVTLSPTGIARTRVTAVMYPAPHIMEAEEA